jgi:hypothetical protein
LNSSRPAVGTGILVALVIVVLVVAAGVSVAYVLGTQPGSTNSASTRSTSTSSSTGSGETSTFYSQVSPAGLQLQIRLNTTEMPQDSGLIAQVSLFNTLSTNLSLTPNFSADAGIVNWDSYDSLCGLTSVDGIFGFALFQGHYAAGNLSQAGAPMLLTPPVASASCPNKFGDEAYIQNVQFAPESVVATMSANSSFSNVFKTQSTEMQVNATTGVCTTSPYAVSGYGSEDGVTTTFSGTELAWGCGTSTGALSGYWTMPVNGTYVGIDSRSNSTITQGLAAVYADYFHQFSPGSYTIVAQDLWNQTVYANFQVAPGPSAASTSSASTPGGATTATSASSASIGIALTSNSSDGLRLGLELQPGGNGTFTVKVDESNILDSVNNVTGANEWRYPAGLLDPFNNCAPGDSPVGFAIFQGYYGMNNYTSGKALPLYNTSTEFSCTENFFPNEFLFQPVSDNVSVYSNHQFQYSTTASVSLFTGGYWTGGVGTSTAATFKTFYPGTYTVLGADEWGNVLLTTFSVS